MPNKFIRFLFFITFTFFVLSGKGQVNSPFTRFGLGEFRPQSFTSQQSMAGLGAAFRHHAYINPINPASFSAFYEEFQIIDTTTGDTLKSVVKAASFETSILARIQNTSNATDKSNSGDGNIGQLALGIPIPGFGGLSFGLIPFSEVDYDIVLKDLSDTNSITNYRFFGEGGLFNLYAGAGYGIKNFSIGAQVKYLFGTITNSSTIYYPELHNSNGTRKLVFSKIRGFTWNAGIQYRAKISDKVNLRLGAFGNPSIKIKAVSDTIWDRVVYVNDQTFGHIDTLSSTLDAEYKIAMPASYGIGFMFERKNKWIAGLEFRTEKWSKIKDFLTQSDQNDSWQIIAGGEVIPDIRKRGLSNKRYRFGVYYGETHLIVNNNSVSDYGITFGIGIPVMRPRQSIFSSIDFSFQAGTRGSINKNLITDNYYQLNLGINLNDSGWIFKTKFY